MTPTEHENRARQLLRLADGLVRTNIKEGASFATVAMAHMQMAEVERRTAWRTENVEEPTVTDRQGNAGSS